MHRRITALVCVASTLALALCGVPAAAFAGDNATAAQQEQDNAAIQEHIDALEDLAAGDDYVSSEVLVTYSGQDEPQQVELADDESVKDALEDALDDDMVTAAQPNYIYSLVDDQSVGASDTASGLSAASTTDDSAGDTLSALQYYLNGDNAGFRGANVTAAWDLVKTNNSVTVAVIDTGIQTSHEDLKDNIDTAHMATVTADGAVEVGSIQDDEGHGTHVAGIVAGTANNGTGIAGSSYNATVLPICVFSDDNTTTLQCLNAVNYLDGLVESGQLANLHVMNMSLGSYNKNTYDDLLYSAISHMASEHDVVCVCAGGNGIRNKAQTKVNYPSDWDVCVGVTSLDAYGADSKWSDYNANKDISAPGEAILSAYTDDLARDPQSKSNLYKYAKDASYGFLDGTSMAAPLVSGIFALMWATYPQLKAKAAVSIVKSTAADVTDSKTSRDRRQFFGVQTGSAGLIDAAAAVAATQELAAANGDEALSDPVAVPVISTAPATVAKLKVKARSRKSLTLAWKAQKGVAGYQVRCKKKGASSWTSTILSDALATGATLGDLKSGKRYKIKIRAFRLATDGIKIYGSFSNVVTKKTKAK